MDEVVPGIPEPITFQPHQLHHKVWSATYEVFRDEPALLLIERPEMAPDSSGWRRYQSIFVVRGDGLGKYMEDMGPAELHLASAFDIPGGDPAMEQITPGDWHTVAELKDYADDFRAFLAKRELQREVPDLIGGYYDQIDQEVRARRKLSQFGPKYAVQRG
jgi:hypothetical protein